MISKPFESINNYEGLFHTNRCKNVKCSTRPVLFKTVIFKKKFKHTYFQIRHFCKNLNQDLCSKIMKFGKREITLSNNFIGKAINPKRSHLTHKEINEIAGNVRIFYSLVSKILDFLDLLDVFSTFWIFLDLLELFWVFWNFFELLELFSNF